MPPRVTLIPPGPISENALLEVRVTGVGDDDAIQVSVDGAPVGHGSQVYWEPRGATGEHRIACTATTDEGPWTEEVTVRVDSTTTRALPRFQLGWIDPGCFSAGFDRAFPATEQDVRDTVDAMASVGMSGLVITYVEWFGAFFYPSEVEFFDRDEQRTTRGHHLGFDLVEAIMSQAALNGMAAFLGLGRSGDLHLLWQFDAPDWDERNAAAIGVATSIADELWARYGHHPSFYGWYLTHEMNDLERASAYYDPVARHCKGLAPWTVVMTAPAGTPIVSSEALDRSEVDVFAYQDAVGAGYVPFEYTWDPQRRLKMLDEVFASYRRAHEGTKKHMWADVEIWEMDGSRGYSGAYAPSFERVRHQIEVASRHCDVLTAYECSGFMQPPNVRARLNDPRAASLYDSYASYVAGART